MQRYFSKNHTKIFYLHCYDKKIKCKKYWNKIIYKTRAHNIWKFEIHIQCTNLSEYLKQFWDKILTLPTDITFTVFVKDLSFAEYLGISFGFSEVSNTL